MRRLKALFSVLLLAGIVLTPLSGQSNDRPSRAIHVVFDDSASMINEDGILLTPGRDTDRWAQAKYAMEVFAAMLEEKDTMSVYYISDFDTKSPHKGNLDAPPRITIKGSENAQGRVNTIHNMVSDAKNTPFDAVTKAYKDIKKINADKKWLVVLTDGEYNQIGGKQYEIEDPILHRENITEVGKIVNGEFVKYTKDKDVQVIILAMGELIKTTFWDRPPLIYVKKAKDSKDILNKITEICNQIFNRDIYPSENKRELKFDLPMTELLVFAQGSNVEIKGIRGAGRFYPPDGETVNVRNSTVPANNYPYNSYPNLKTPNLTGVVARFGNIPKGEYGLEYTGTDNIEVYIKPEVNLKIKLFKDDREIPINDKNGRNIFDDINEDEYRIEFGILDENGNFFKPEILKNVRYTVKINGEEIQTDSGDNSATVTLTKGKTEINVRAGYLNTSSTEETVTGTVLDKRSPIDRFLDWVRRNRTVIMAVSGALLALLLIWFLWGTKPRFPKRDMSFSPVIRTKRNGYENPGTRDYGTFFIYPRTKIAPLIPEKGRIKFVPDDFQFSDFSVVAKDRSTMILTNSRSFTAKSLEISRVKVRVDGRPVTEDRMEISCTATITTVVPAGGGNPETIYTCYLGK